MKFGMVIEMIEIKDLTKTFGQKKALDNISFSVTDGSIFGLVGSNGAGKSTLIRVLAGVFEPDSGNVYLNGVAHLKMFRLRAKRLTFRIFLISFQVQQLKVWQLIINLFIHPGAMKNTHISNQFFLLMPARKSQQ